MFADDTILFIIVDNPDVDAEILNADHDKIVKWAEAWLVKFNHLRTMYRLSIHSSEIATSTRHHKISTKITNEIHASQI